MNFNMAVFRILIVDDQVEIRNLLRSLLETLGPKYQVVTVPSGEEALLEFFSGDIDLLITDIVLPGIDGIEFMKKAKSRYPGLKVIIITDRDDRKTQREVDAAGADEFLLKPMVPRDFLDSVERCLGIAESFIPAPGKTELEGPEKPKGNLPDFLTRLRQDLNATSVILLADSGDILARAGDFPDASFENLIVPALVTVFNTGGALSKLLRAAPPRAFQFFTGLEYDLILTQVGNSFALLLVLDSNNAQQDFSAILKRLHAGVVDLFEILSEIGVNLDVENHPISVDDDFLDAVALVEETPLIDALFKEGEANPSKAEEVEAFWDSISENEATNEISKADVLTYDQALKLGLVPGKGDSNDEE